MMLQWMMNESSMTVGSSLEHTLMKFLYTARPGKNILSISDGSSHSVCQANLSLKLSKCRFGLQQVEYLGHVIGGGVILGSLKAVRHYNKRPETKTEVKSFLGLISYYRKFVPQYATISTPLSDLLKVQCTPECKRAFQTLKKKLGESPALIVLDFVVQTDASNVGIGAVLNQKGADDKEHPVAFVGHKLKLREKNYSVVEKE